MKFLAFLIAAAGAWLLLPAASAWSTDWALGKVQGFYGGLSAADLVLIWEGLLLLLIFAAVHAALRLLGAAAGLIVTLWLVAREKLR